MDKKDFESLKKQLQETGALPIKIASDSMVPLLKVSEALVVMPIEKKVKMFDLIVFYQSERLNCHFVWRDQTDFNNCYVTRSLKEPRHDDPPVPTDCVLGTIPGKNLSILNKLKVLACNLM